MIAQTNYWPSIVLVIAVLLSTVVLGVTSFDTLNLSPTAAQDRNLEPAAPTGDKTPTGGLGFETVIILVLVGVIVGLVAGVALSRPPIYPGGRPPPDPNQLPPIFCGEVFLQARITKGLTKSNLKRILK